ncbi:PilT/PilU family type 4a pilus ATPase [Candidatus Gracilibacteria bacterium]|nr:PilT/PilU family type 4a pilus ATPase [Candidatus Gracilibacteria bacterium]
MDLEKILIYAIEKEASDIHISSNLPVFFRINGKMLPFGENLLAGYIYNLSLKILTQKQQSELDENRNIDFVYTSKTKNRFRGNAYYTREGLCISLRMILENIPRFETLGLPKIVLERVMRRNQGLILVVGPTGQGKSTTLASLLRHRSEYFSEHIITLEDPIEFIIKSQKSVVHQRNRGRDVKSFNLGLKSALREDPDVLMVGEMRDLETISLALTAAETGHLVFSTLHTKNAPETIDRIIDVFPSDQQSQIRTQLASTLEMVISQRLLPTLNGKRILAYEILVSNYAIKNHIRQGSTHQISNAMQTDNTGRMVLFDQCLASLVLKGEISLKTALQNAVSEEQVKYILELRSNESGKPIELELH